MPITQSICDAPLGLLDGIFRLDDGCRNEFRSRGFN